MIHIVRPATKPPLRPLRGHHPSRRSTDHQLGLAGRLSTRPPRTDARRRTGPAFQSNPWVPPPRNCTRWPAWSSWPTSTTGPPRRPPRLTSSAATSNTPSTWSPASKSRSRTVERYQKLFREDELAAQVFHDVTTGLTEKLELDISRQRLDSTHVFTHMASFGRTKLMAVAIKRFLTQVIRHAPEQYAALPEDVPPAATNRRNRTCSPAPRMPRLGSGRGSKQPRTCAGSSNTSPIVPT